MERYIEMKSPLTGGKVKEISTTEVKNFRKEDYKVNVRYYVCEDTGEKFTTTEQDQLLFNELYAQYRIKHGIPFPDEIKDIRQKYGLNYTQISKILGFGINQYAKYEAGEVPSESNGKMIAAIRDKNVLLELLKNCKETFLDSEYNKIFTAIKMSGYDRNEYSALFKIIYVDDSRSIFNGYGRKNIERLFDMVCNIISIHGEIFPTKLNKVMFYADFYHYRKVGESISGLQYRAMNFGPVPDRFATIYDNVSNVKKRMIEAHGMVGTLLSYSGENNFPSLSDAEKETIDFIVNRLKPLTVSEIIEESHKEEGWKNASTSQSLIPYDSAFELKLV